MAKPTNAPLAGEIWHLSIDDLFAPVQDKQRLGGPGPFVISLSVSTAPIMPPPKEFSGRWEAHVYQIQVTEDGRMRYRLRLGPFAIEDEADAILQEVRETYPGAMTATAGAADLRTVASIQAKLDLAKAPPKKPEKAAPEITIDLAQPLAKAAAIVAKRLGESPKPANRAAPIAKSTALRAAADAPPPVAALPPRLSPEWALPVSNTRAAAPAPAAIANPAPAEVAAATVAPKMPATPPSVPVLVAAPAPIPRQTPSDAAPSNQAPVKIHASETAAGAPAARTTKWPAPRPAASRWVAPNWTAPRWAAPRPAARRPAAPSAAIQRPTTASPAAAGPAAPTPSTPPTLTVLINPATPGPASPNPPASSASAPAVRRSEERR